MNTKSNLQWDEFIKFLSSKAHSKSVLSLISHLTPFDNSNLKLEIKLVQAALEFVQINGRIYFNEISDLTSFFNSLRIEGFIPEIHEIIETAHMISEIIEIKNRIIGADENHFLLTLFQDIEIPSELISMTSRVFDKDGHIRDNASPTLAEIRRTRQKVRTHLHQSLNETLEKYKLQERIITVRDGRFVIPVKSGMRGEIKGIVHGFSKSAESAFIEPEYIVNENNHLVEIDEQEHEEIRRILKDLTKAFSDQNETLLQIYLLYGRLEWIFIRAIYAIENSCHFPEISETPLIELISARHPMIDPKKVVPIDVIMNTQQRGLIISGPNAGGKTVAMKTVGLLSMMFSHAIPLPVAKNSKLFIFNHIFAEIGDEQNLLENLSSFSGHIRALTTLLNQVDNQSLVLIDEIMAATDPREGEALGRVIVKQLIEMNCFFIVTTHYHGIKELAYSFENIQNAFVEYNQKEYKPEYRLHIGGTGSSFAIEMAARFGLAQKLIREAQEYLNSHLSDEDKIIREIEKERQKAAQWTEKAAMELRQARQMQHEYQKKLRELEQEQKKLRHQGLEKLSAEMNRTIRELAELRRNIKRKKKIEKTDALDQARKILKEETQKETALPRVDFAVLKAGDKVYIANIQKEGIIENIQENKAQVRVGLLKIDVSKDDLFLPHESQDNDNKHLKGFQRSLDFDYSLDIRGMRVEDALRLLERNLESAYVRGQSECEIIHGMGTGALKKAVRDYLRELPFVKSFEYAKPKEGGQGKTIVKMG